MQRIMEYVGIDGMNIDVIQNAIERCANSNIRNFNYLNGILERWSKRIKTLEQVKQDDEAFKQAESFKVRVLIQKMRLRWLWYSGSGY